MNVQVPCARCGVPHNSQVTEAARPPAGAGRRCRAHTARVPLSREGGMFLFATAPTALDSVVCSELSPARRTRTTSVTRVVTIKRERHSDLTCTQKHTPRPDNRTVSTAGAGRGWGQAGHRGKSMGTGGWTSVVSTRQTHRCQSIALSPEIYIMLLTSVTSTNRSDKCLNVKTKISSLDSPRYSPEDWCRPLTAELLSPGSA